MLYEWKLIFHCQQRCVAIYKGHPRSHRHMAHLPQWISLLHIWKVKSTGKKCYISSGDFTDIL